MAKAAAASSKNGKRHKDFGSALKYSDLDPLTFELCGKEFHCRPALQSKRLLHFVAEADTDSGARAGAALHSFLEEVIFPEDIEAWREIVDGDEYIVDAALLGDIVSWLVEQYSARPTQQ